MTQQQSPTGREVFGELFDSLEAILRWLGRVVTIGIGVCLGLILFVLVVTRVFVGILADVDMDGRTPSYSSTSSIR